MAVGIQWTKKYPSQDILRKEIQAEVDAAMEMVFKTFGKKNIRGIYFKGSASKKWDSIIDFVPEFSDIDIHVLFNEDNLMHKMIGKVPEALRFGKEIEAAFMKRIKKPLYLPRLQLLSLNEMHKKDFFVPSPIKIVQTIYGVDYISRPVSSEENISHALSGIYEHEKFIENFAHKVMDSNHDALPKDLRDMFWRISSLGNNTLALLGLSFDNAWTLNRTGVVKELQRFGQNKLAKQYVLFYKHSWDYVLTKDPDYARSAMIVGHEFIGACIIFAKKYESSKKK
jgi:hypothetical protein